MEPKVLENTTLEKEIALLQLFKDNWTTNPKKLKKFVKRIWFDQPVFLQEGMLTNLLKAKDPVEYLCLCIQQSEEYPVIIKQLIDDGKHGFMVVNNTIHPIEVKTVSSWLKPGDKWTDEDETDILDKWVKAWMEENNVKRIEARIMLFSEFGFSGIMKLATYERSIIK